MNSSPQSLIEVFHLWALPFAVILLMFVSIFLTRAVLRRVKDRGGWTFLRELGPLLSYFIYIIGLKIFGEVSPLHPRVLLWLEDILFVFATFLMLGLIRRAALLAIEWSAMRTHHSKTLQQGFIPLMRNVITLFVFFAGSIMVLKHFNYDVMSLITALGVGSLAVGLAAKDTLSNMISGFVLIIDRNLRPGDRINLAGSIGDVEEIGLRSTRIKTGDGNILIVPNAELVNTKILNLSLPSKATSASTRIRVHFDVSFSHMKTICESIVRELHHVDHDRNLWVTLGSLAEGYQLINVGFWVVDIDRTGDALTEFHQKLLTRLAQEKISLVEFSALNTLQN